MSPSITLDPNSTVSIPLDTQEHDGCCCGRYFKVMNEKAKDFFITTFTAIGEAFKTRSPLSKIGKIGINVLTGIGHVAGQAFRGAGLLRVLSVADSLFDFCDIITDVNGLVHHAAADKVQEWSLIANVSFFTADVIGLALWLDELTFISLSQIGAGIGNGFSKLSTALGEGFTKFITSAQTACPFAAKLVAKITLVNVLRGVVIGAFAALTVHECKNFVDGIREKNIQKSVISGLYIASFVAEIALKILAIAGIATVPGLVIAGCVAAGLGLTAFLLEVICKIREENAKKQMESQMKIPKLILPAKNEIVSDPQAVTG